MVGRVLRPCAHGGSGSCGKSVRGVEVAHCSSVNGCGGCGSGGEVNFVADGTGCACDLRTGDVRMVDSGLSRCGHGSRDRGGGGGGATGVVTGDFRSRAIDARSNSSGCDNRDATTCYPPYLPSSHCRDG